MGSVATVLAWVVTSADPGPVEVRGDGTCLTTAGLEARVQSWGGRTQWPSDVAIVAEHGGSTLTVRVTRGVGEPVERRFIGVPAACDDIELMAAVAIAMAIDVLEQAIPIDEGTPATNLRVSAPEPLAQGTPPPGVTITGGDVRVRPRRPQVSLVGAGGGAIGLMPFATGEAALGVRIAWARVAVVGELEVGARRVTGVGGETGSLRIARVAATLGICAPWTRGRWTAGLCALGTSGPMIAAARDTTAPRTAVVPWVGTVARTELAVALSPRWSLVARSDVVIGLVRPVVAAVQIETDRVTSWPTPPVGWRGTAAVQLRLGRIPRGPVKRPSSARMDAER